MELVRKAKNVVKRYLKSRKKVNHRNRGYISFIDVGSVGGLPAPWDEHADKIRLLLNFEPRDEPHFGKNIITYNCALWEDEQERPFYIYRGLNQSGSSLFEQNYDYVREHYEHLKNQGPKWLAETWFERSELERVTQVKCRALDDVVREVGGGVDFHFLKVDAQGAEYQILRGATNLLSTTLVGLHLELFTIPLYKDMKLLPDVESFLEQYGFVLVRKLPAHGTFDSQHDCLFIKRESQGPIVEAIRAIYGIT